MSAAVLCIGTELTRGELVNSNASWLAERLTAIGLEVIALDCVDDDRARIEAALRRVSEQSATVICTGGLGPTTDDITTECAARVADVGLRRDPGALAHIERLLSRVGRRMADSNAKQADFPEGASIIENPNGTAPGFALRLGRAIAYFLPGVPREMKAMFEASVAPALAALVEEPRHQVILRTFGLPEAEVNDRLRGVEAAHGVLLGYRATLPEIEVKVLGRGPTASAARELAERAADEVRSRLGDHVFAEGATTLPELVGRLLEARALTLAVAESCTGGLAADLVTRAPGASRYFRGGAVTYADSAKHALLGVPEATLREHGAVSESVARAMAEGVRERLATDYGLAFTGIAGPSGCSEEKPVGLVHYALAGPGETLLRQRVFFGGRQDVRRRAVFAGLDLLRRKLQGLSVEPASPGPR
jgi:nicotinamide-nucleotide amidase